MCVWLSNHVGLDSLSLHNLGECVLQWMQVNQYLLSEFMRQKLWVNPMCVFVIALVFVQHCNHHHYHLTIDVSLYLNNLEVWQKRPKRWVPNLNITGNGVNFVNYTFQYKAPTWP